MELFIALMLLAGGTAVTIWAVVDLERARRRGADASAARNPADPAAMIPTRLYTRLLAGAVSATLGVAVAAGHFFAS